MNFSLSIRERLLRARSDLASGLPIILLDNNKIWAATAVETLSQSQLETFRTLPHFSISVTDWRAKALRLGAYDGDLTRIIPHTMAELYWFHALCDPALDFKYPIKGPFNVLRDGTTHPHRLAIRLCKQAGLLPSVIVGELSFLPSDLTWIKTNDAEQALNQPPSLKLVSTAPVPLKSSKKSQVMVFRGDDGKEHYVILIGERASNRPILSRLHSACFTGDVIGSLKCDCGAQLNTALNMMGAEGAGLLLYLNQEGRGIGLANKIRAYALQNLGFDTVDANHRLGFEDDERNFLIGAELLKILRVKETRLLTNNPAKVEKMRRAGIRVTERIALKVGETRENINYLKTKRNRSGHLL